MSGASTRELVASKDEWKMVAWQLRRAREWSDSVGGIEEARAWLELLSGLESLSVQDPAPPFAVPSASEESARTDQHQPRVAR